MLVIDGEGAPEGDAFQSAVAVLDRVLAAETPLEGTYWSGDDEFTFDLEDPDGWRWYLAVPAAPDATERPDGVRLETLAAQRVARLVHSGPYVAEGPSLAALYAFIAERGMAPAGAHTEVYLTDPRLVDAEQLRTELRVPVR